VFSLVPSALSQTASQRLLAINEEKGWMWKLHGLNDNMVDQLINIGFAETRHDKSLHVLTWIHTQKTYVLYLTVTTLLMM
jgi:hypothetical protein